jgi:hypothetical protein
LELDDEALEKLRRGRPYRDRVNVDPEAHELRDPAQDLGESVSGYRDPDRRLSEERRELVDIERAFERDEGLGRGPGSA